MADRGGLPSAPPGYYDDPFTPGGKRYWDGTSWGEPQGPEADTAPAEEASADEPSTAVGAESGSPRSGSRHGSRAAGRQSTRSAGSTNRRRWVLVGAVAVALVVVAAVAVFALRSGDTGDDAASEPAAPPASGSAVSPGAVEATSCDEAVRRLAEGAVESAAFQSLFASCSSLEEFEAVKDDYPDYFQGATTEEFLGPLCENVFNAAQSALCIELAGVNS